MARLLLLSPYHGGSHRGFAMGLVRHSRHQIELLSLPPRFWKWRMRGAALLLAERAARLEQSYDLVIATDMMNLAEFRALAGGSVPHLLYLHENQLSYPLPAGERPDLHLGFTNLASALTADGLVFNSRFHRHAFFNALPGLLSAMPDCRPRRTISRLTARARVIPVGCEINELQNLPCRPQAPFETRPARWTGAEPPLILWNHRWEFDKAPEVFFRVLARLDDAGLRFRLALAGDCSQARPKLFMEARRRYGERVVQYGRVEGRGAYGRLLGQADLVISTARQENFGVAVVEAMACGAWPLLPRRLAYPELLPQRWHNQCLYEDESGLEQRLASLLRHGLPVGKNRTALADCMLRYDWSALIGTYDDLFEALMARAGPGQRDSH